MTEGLCCWLLQSKTMRCDRITQRSMNQRCMCTQFNGTLHMYKYTQPEQPRFAVQLLRVGRIDQCAFLLCSRVTKTEKCSLRVLCCVNLISPNMHGTKKFLNSSCSSDTITYGIYAHTPHTAPRPHERAQRQLVLT